MIEFGALNDSLLARAHYFVPSWLPGGKVYGNEYKCADIHGGEGESLSVNLNTGKWSDFATSNMRGGDLVSLYAAINGLSQGESAQRLATETGNTSVVIKEQPRKAEEIKPIPAPTGIKWPNGPDEPDQSWKYTDKDGNILFLVYRYNDADNKKRFTPFTYTKERAWIKKGYPSPRPLYNLASIHADKIKPVLVVEGEKSADAAEKLLGDLYIVTTWSNGANAWDKTDWSPLVGRSILLWPDADAAGIAAMNSIGDKLKPTAKVIKKLCVEPTNGWDAADALDSGWDKLKCIAWAKGLVQVIADNEKIEPEEFKPVEAEVMPKAEPMPTAGLAIVDLEALRAAQDAVNFKELWTALGLDTSDKGIAFQNVDNCLRIMTKDDTLKDKVWFDSFHQKRFTNMWSPQVKEWNEGDTISLMVYMQGQIGFRQITKTHVEDAVEAYCLTNTKNEPRDWMNTLTWDGTPRIDSFFSLAFHAYINEYTTKASRNWWISMVARILKPGCKSDNMVILEGPQGTYKSTALAVIGGKWYAEIAENPNSKDFFQSIQAKMLIEIGELDSFNKAESTTIKKIITTTTDRYRASYARYTKDYPRQCVFVGTTNESEYLRDTTGNRRFWPIRINLINLEYIRANRDQLFAESVLMFKQGESWWEMPASAKLEQEARRETDPWEEIILDFVSDKESTTVNDIAFDCLEIDRGHLKKFDSNRIGKCLRSIGWDNKVKRVDGINRNVWSRTSSANPLIEKKTSFPSINKPPVRKDFE